MLFAIFGGLLINANNDDNIHIIIPGTFISLGAILFIYSFMLKFLDHERMSSKYK